MFHQHLSRHLETVLLLGNPLCPSGTVRRQVSGKVSPNKTNCLGALIIIIIIIIMIMIIMMMMMMMMIMMIIIIIIII